MNFTVYPDVTVNIRSVFRTQFRILVVHCSAKKASLEMFNRVLNTLLSVMLNIWFDEFILLYFIYIHTAQKMKFPIKYFFRFLQRYLRNQFLCSVRQGLEISFMNVSKTAVICGSLTFTKDIFE